MDEGGELRWNPLTLRWVVVAPGRAARPHDTAPRGGAGGAGAAGWAPASEAPPEDAPSPDAPAGRPGTEPRTDPACPFCPGNEAELPAILMELPGRAGEPWSFRAVPNRYAAFRGAEGAQEVLVEGPDHDASFATMGPDALERAVEGYAVRYAAMADRPEVRRVLLFRNRGREAGSSLHHPHAQLVGTALDPPEMLAREAAFRRIREEHGGVCPLCEPETLDADHEERVVRETPRFRCHVPRAAEAPFEMWIVPADHPPGFEALADDPRARVELAGLLGWAARRLRTLAGDPPWNLLLHSAGTRDPHAADLHWWMRLVPRVGQHAGLELLSGVRVNPSSPEADARRLRSGAGDGPPSGP